MRSRLIRFGLCTGFALVAALGSTQLFAGKPGGGGGGGCPRGTFCLCAAIYCPVTCAGGCHYSNPCIADCAGATGCVLDGGSCGIEP